MRDDLRAAVRSLSSSKSFTAVALIVLALGVGASTAIFSVVDAVVLKGLPFDADDELVAVGERRPPGPRPDPNRDPNAVGSASPQNYMDWMAAQQVFESMAATTTGTLTLRDPGQPPEELLVQRVTAGFFHVLRVQPALGRGWSQDNEVEGQHRVVVLSHAFWQRRFGNDPDVIGRTIPLDQYAYEIVGVMPPEFEYPVAAVRATALWLPYVVPPDERVRVGRRMSIYLQVIARLKPGVSVERAQAQMNQVAIALQQAHPVWNKETDIGVRPLVDHWVGARTKSWMFMLLGAVGLVLLIACANVANLILVRATGRTGELAIRAALGASRWRLVRQLMVESVLLSGLGTIAAVALAWWAVHVLRAAMPDNLPRVSQMALDVRVLGCAFGLALGTGMVFGILPALQLSRPTLSQVLNEVSRGAVGGARHWMGNALVVAEVALAVVLLTGAALFIGSFAAVVRIDPGFDPTHVLTAQVSPRLLPGDSNPDASALMLDLVEQIGQIRGVVHSSAVSGGIPLAGGASITGLTVPGKPLDGRRDRGISFRRVTPAYHSALGMRLIRGRLFEPADRAGAPPVMIINESAASTYFAGEDPIGRSARLEDDGMRVVVGVVGDVYQTSLEAKPFEEAYVPMAQARTTSGELVIRTTGDPYEVLPAVKSAALTIFPDVPLRSIRTMDELLARRVAQRKLNMLLMGLFGLFGLTISVFGLYGVLSYVVAERTREIGVRMALGAGQRRIVGTVVGQAFVLLTLGLVVGIAGAWSLTAVAQPFLFGVDAADPRVFGAVAASLSLAGLIAAAIPAWRAATVDPNVALRAG